MIIPNHIYTNLKKAVQYIVSIHIPIILTVSLPLFLGWNYPDIFTPVHVIFLELVMGPMCSIVYENEPAEKNSMQQRPRQLGSTFLSFKEMAISIIQGLVITIAILIVYQLTVQNGGTEIETRTMVFTTLVLSNVLLSLVNRSFNTQFFTFLKKPSDHSTTCPELLLNKDVMSHSSIVISLEYICEAKKLPSLLRAMSLK